MKPYFGSEIAEHDVTITPFPADLLWLSNFALAKMRKIDPQRDMESLVTLLPFVWELFRKEYREGPFRPLTGRGLSCGGVTQQPPS